MLWTKGGGVGCSNWCSIEGAGQSTKKKKTISEFWEICTGKAVNRNDHGLGIRRKVFFEEKARVNCPMDAI